MTHIDIVFTGPPGPTGCEFVEVEDHTGRSIRFGEWVTREDGYTVLRFTDSRAELLALRGAVDEFVDGGSVEVSREEFDAAVERLRKEYPSRPLANLERIVCQVLGLDEPPRKKPEPWVRSRDDADTIAVAPSGESIGVWINSHWALLTPDEARGMAAALIAHADYADYAYPKGADDE